jgi:V/A-type H+-transporting ATPase subunit G/H
VAKETVEAVRLAELNAAEREKEAIQKKEEMLLEAQQNAAALITSMEKDSLAKAQRDVNDAIRRGKENMVIARKNAEKEALILKELAKEKEKEAIQLVLSDVI